MLAVQFLQTTKEIQSLCASKRISAQVKVTLEAFLGQEVNDANLLGREQTLENINSRLAKEVIEGTFFTEIRADNLGLTRLPKSLLLFLVRYQEQIKSIRLGSNYLRSVPLDILRLPSLEIIDLRHNCLTTGECEKIKQATTCQVFLEPQQSLYEEFDLIRLDDEPPPVLLSGGPAKAVPPVRPNPPASSQREKRRSSECCLQ
jgi:hypothetical protein